MRTILLTLLMVLYTTFAHAGSFTDNGNGTVTDNITGLMWQKQDDATTKTWDDAIVYCEGLSLGGYTDWGLPNVKELSSLVDDSQINRSIDALFNTGTRPSTYWSSTTSDLDWTYVWGVQFYSGDTGIYEVAGLNYVRCVRGE